MKSLKGLGLTRPPVPGFGRREIYDLRKKILRPTSFILILIFILALFLRLYNISSNPPSLNWDEAALGYNAYSLGIDGRDEFGRLLPIDYLESFGDFKPPLYSYLAVIPVKIFGLNEFGIRFPSALFGSLMVLFTYFLMRELFVRKNKILNTKYEILGLLAAGLLAISPWHIMLSRSAFEANIAAFLTMAGALFFLMAINRRPYYLIFSAVFFALSFYAFNSARVFAPMLAVGLALLFYKNLLTMKKEVLIAVLVGSVMILPISKFLLSPQAALRFNEVNIFSDPAILEESNKKIDNAGNTVFARLIHNRRIIYGREYLKHYLDNLNPSFFFVKGDENPRFSTRDVGQLYLWELPFIILGTLFLFRRREGYWFVIPFWLLAGIIPAGVARETPHALRIESSLPMFQLLVAYGILKVLETFKDLRLMTYDLRRKIIILGLISYILLSAGNILYFLHGLFNHYPREYSGQFQYPYKTAVVYLEKHKDDYDNIFVTNELGRPYIYFLVYGKMGPSEFRETAEVRRESFGFVHIDTLGKYTFIRDAREEADNPGRNLFVDVPGRMAAQGRVVAEFRNLDGSDGLVAYE